MEVIVNSNEKIIWSALEYEDKIRSQDWFWALGIIVITSSIAAIIFENYFRIVFRIVFGLFFFENCFPNFFDFYF